MLFTAEIECKYICICYISNASTSTSTGGGSVYI
jgi:hypothetical protein